MAYMRDSKGRKLDTYTAAARRIAASLGPYSQSIRPAVNAEAITTDHNAMTAARSFSAAGFGSANAAGSVGDLGTWDSTNVKRPPASTIFSGLDFLADDTQVRFTAITQTASGLNLWVWVDGQPVTAAPETVAAAAGASVGTNINFPSRKMRRVTVYAGNINAWQSIQVLSQTGGVYRVARRPRVAYVGDSFWAGTTSIATAVESGAAIIGRALGSDIGNYAIGGTGYLLAGSANTFGSSARVASVQSYNPELIFISGSVNDDAYTYSQVLAAATATYAAYAAACPGVPIIVLGTQPNSHGATLSAARAAVNKALKDACAAAPNVIGFIDRLGNLTGSVPAAWGTNGVYNNGDLVTYKGGCYEWQGGNGVSTGSNTPYSTVRWVPKTFALTGTGSTAATAGDGNRDIYLGSDSIHPTPDGQYALCQADLAAIRDLLYAA